MSYSYSTNPLSLFSHSSPLSLSLAHYQGGAETARQADGAAAPRTRAQRSGAGAGGWGQRRLEGCDMR